MLIFWREIRKIRIEIECQRLATIWLTRAVVFYKCETRTLTKKFKALTISDAFSGNLIRNECNHQWRATAAAAAAARNLNRLNFIKFYGAWDKCEKRTLLTTFTATFESGYWSLNSQFA